MRLFSRSTKPKANSSKSPSSSRARAEPQGAAKKTSKKTVTWRDERGGELANVRYVSPVGERTKLGPHVRTGSKRMSSKKAEALSAKRRAASIATAETNFANAKRQVEAYEGALNVVSKRLRNDPNDAKKKFIVERAKKLLNEKRVNLEIATERRRSAKLAAKRGY